nr:putative carbonic anhydrase 3 [Lepeophtheirus salmonis]
MNIIAFIFLSFVCAKVYSKIDHPRNHAYWKSFENFEKRLCKEGSRQSPINIEKDKVIKAKFKPFHFENYDAEVNASMSNNGHSIVLEIKQSTKHTSLPRISYGGLGGTYEILELHFHWGINYNEGSEHRISGTSFPIELHMVHKKVGDKFDKKLPWI